MNQTDELTLSPRTNLKKRLVKLFVLLVFLAVFVAYYFANRQDFSVLANVGVGLLVLILIGQIVVMVTNALLLSALCTGFEKNLSFKNSISLTIKSSIINFFGFLQGGVGYKAYYLKKKFKLQYSKFFLIFMANYLAIFSVSSLLALIGLIIRKAEGHSINFALLLLFLIIELCIAGIMLFGHKLHFSKEGRLTRYINQSVTAWSSIAKNKKVLLKLFLFSLLQCLSLSFIFYLELRAIGLSPSIASVLIYSGLANLALFLAITPGAIGFRESILIFSQTSLSIQTSDILASSLLDRAIYFLLLGIGALAISKVGRKIFNKFFVET
jgi:uncharacterized protein (TIRG00374 family)